MNAARTTWRNVLITGASSGIGQTCALALEQAGFRVFAGVRNPADAEALRAKALPQLTPITLDVTREDSIRAAVEEMTRLTGGEGLQALVNNAGIAVAGPLEFLPLDEVRRQLDVNVTGQLAVTQACLPLLRQAKQARIINMSSVAGKVAFPMMGPYCMSKHALEAMSHALRMELKPWGIHVALIQPGRIATPIWQKSVTAAEQLAQRLPAKAFEHYGPVLEQARLRALRSVHRGLEPQQVSRAVIHAVTSPRPQSQYVVGRDCRMGIWLSLLPDFLRDRILLRRYGE